MFVWHSMTRSLLPLFVVFLRITQLLAVVNIKSLDVGQLNNIIDKDSKTNFDLLGGQSILSHRLRSIL